MRILLNLSHPHKQMKVRSRHLSTLEATPKDIHQRHINKQTNTNSNHSENRPFPRSVFSITCTEIIYELLIRHPFSLIKIYKWSGTWQQRKGNRFSMTSQPPPINFLYFKLIVLIPRVKNLVIFRVMKASFPKARAVELTKREFTAIPLTSTRLSINEEQAPIFKLTKVISSG